MKLKMPVGTLLGFKDVYNVYRLKSQDITPPCSPECKERHPHRTEALIQVEEVSTRTIPLSRLLCTFDEENHGTIIENLSEVIEE